MILLAPVNSLEAAMAQISAGATELYLGLKSDVYKHYSFSGRGQTSKQVSSVTPDKTELEKITKYAHAHNATISLAANTAIFSDYAVPNIQEKYIQHVMEGIDAGIDHVIVGDIGLMYELSRMNLPINIHASTYFDTMSVDQLKFLKSLSVTRAVMTYQSHIDEIESLCKAGIMEIELFCYLSCSFFNGSCNLIHDKGESGSDEKRILGVPCKSSYRVWGENIEESTMSYFDSELSCALCSVKKLMECGVDVIKIAGRELDYKITSEVTKLFSRGIQLAECTTLEEYQEKVKELPYNWWKKVYCSRQRCKYKKNPITESYIGIK